MPAADPTALAREWAVAVTGTAHLPMERAELEAFLAGLASQLLARLAGEPHGPCPGQEIGARLVASHLATPEAIGRSIELLARRLPEAVPADPPDPAGPAGPVGPVGPAGPADGADPAAGRARMTSLLGGVATGFARALRERTLAEQEAIRRAAQLAQTQAEAALRESEARYRYQATHDPLTDLANRTLFTQRLAALFAQGTGAGRQPRRLGVCFVDLDGFKVVNDTLGHHVGDQLLAVVAERLRSHLPGPGRLVARVGGDEFVILIEDTTCLDDAIKVAETALAAIAQPTYVDGHELAVSASIGIVERKLGMSSPSEVMRAADLTLQWAKAEGKGRWAVFDPARNQQELARYELTAAIPAALKRGELFLDYQPIVSLSDGEVRAVAALVQWRHPERGVLGADKFLGLAAETGVIVRLGEWVLSEACQQARRWEPGCPYPPLVSVALTPRQVRDPGLVETVTGRLDRSGLAPSRLQLEINEAALIGPDGGPGQNLCRLADLGVRIAVADFGTGYCNLPSLRTLPVRELKLASTLVAGLRSPLAATRPTTGEQVVATLVSLAHTLGFTVTAEGVETAGQARRLRALGCDAAQGGHIGSPTSPDRLARRLAVR